MDLRGGKGSKENETGRRRAKGVRVWFGRVGVWERIGEVRV